MKAPSTIAAVLAATAVLAVDARQMHAKLDYHRYLAEREDTLVELAAWKTKFGEVAKNNGWWPVSEDRSDEEEDHLQRFALTKQGIENATAQNPNATFSVDSPFSLLTDDEWHSFFKGGYHSTTARRLRGRRSYHGGRSSAMGIPTSLSDAAGSNTKTTTSRSGNTVTTTTTSSGSGKTYTSTTTTTDNGNGGTSTKTSWSSTWSSDATPSATAATTNSGSSGFGGYDFSSIFDNWDWSNWSNWGTVEPAGGSSDSTSYTSAPAAPTSAPAATYAPTTSAPVATTSAPVATTSAPAATTAAPAATTAAPAATTESTNSANTGTTSSVASDADTSSVDWSSTTCMSPIQYQGVCGDCWAFATVAAVESAQCIANGQKSITKYSEQQLTSCDTQNQGCNGGAPQYAFDYIQENGLCTETDYPFTSGDSGSTGSCTTGCSAATTGITGYESLSTASDLATAVAQRPVVVAVASSNTAWKQYTSGTISSCDTSTLDHAVVVVGYTDTAWKIRNSWGETWGEQGYIYLSRSSDSTGVCGMYTDMSYPTI